MTARCRHCEQPLPPKPVEGQFCCHGCAGAYHLLQNLNLTCYYDRRSTDERVRPLIPEACTLQHLETYIQQDGTTATLHLMVEGLHCAACVWLIETVLAKQPGVMQARLNMTTQRLLLSWDTTQTTAETLLGEVYKLGYRLLPYDPALLASTTRQEEKFLLLCLAVAGFAAANVMLLSVGLWAGAAAAGGPTAMLLQGYSALIVLPAALWAGQPFYRSAWQALRHRRMNMDVPITLAVLVTLGLSLYDMVTARGETYFESTAMLLFFLLIGRYLDLRARGKSRHAAEQLAALQATVATRLNAAGEPETVPIHDLRAGDTLLVARGERLAADGVVIDGTSTLDTSILTGESLPRTVAPGGEVQAGLVNLEAPLRLRVTAVGEHTAIARVIQLVENATQAKNRQTRIADRVARAYAPVVHVLAAGTLTGWVVAGAGWHTALTNATAVLIVTCPCALALAVPAVQVAIVSRLLRLGVILKSAIALENLRQVTDVVLDKTGTLTTGAFQVVSGGTTHQRRMAAALAAYSRHPLAQAVARLEASTLPVTNLTETPGQGVAGTVDGTALKLGSRAFCGVGQEVAAPVQPGQTEVWLAEKGKHPVCFVCADTLRPDAAAAVEDLQRAGLAVQVLSGDRADTVASVASAAGIAHWQANQTPEAKYAAVTALQAQGHRVLMVGDGINDAPCLAAADVGFSFGDASHIAQTGADVLLQNNRLRDVATTWRLSKVAHRAVMMNFGFSFAYNTVAVPLAMAGFISPLWAALLMSASSLTVVLNALRIGLPTRQKTA